MIQPEEALQYYWEGITRSYRRLKKVEQGEWYEKDFGSELDLYYFFFIKCYHLKDWINGTVSRNSDQKRKIADFVRGTSELSLCRDVCNAAKHYYLIDASKPHELVGILAGEGISLFREYIHPADRINKREYQIRIQARDKRWNAIELASACMNRWKDFIERNWNVKLSNF